MQYRHKYSPSIGLYIKHNEYPDLYNLERLNELIKHDSGYRSNPTNYYHHEYQSSINRIFAVLMILVGLITSINLFGVASTVMFIIATVVILMISFLVIAAAMEIIPDFVNFLKGR